MAVLGIHNYSRLIILAAVEEELTDLRAGLPANNAIDLAAVGCGLVEAAMNTALLLKKLECSNGLAAVIFIGSAGSYDHSVQLLTPVIADRVLLCDSAVSLGHGYFPEIMVTSLHPDAGLAASLLGLDLQSIKSGTFSSPLAITADRRLGKITQLELGARFENLELFGVASACAATATPWSNLSMITNHIHSLAHKEWNQNHAQASKFTAAMILNWINRTGILASAEETAGRTEG